MAKRRRRFQEDWSFLATAASTTEANFLAATSREPRGILFRIFTAYLFGRRCGSSSSPWTGEAGPCCTLSNGGDAALLVSGGAREPEQRMSTGPWVRTKPVFVSVKTLRHTEHAALVELAPSVRASWASRVSSTLSCSLLDDSHTYSSTSTPSDADGRSRATAIFSHLCTLLSTVNLKNTSLHLAITSFIGNSSACMLCSLSHTSRFVYRLLQCPLPHHVHLVHVSGLLE